MKTVIVLETRPTQLLTTWREGRYKREIDRLPNTHSLYADHTAAFNREEYEQGLCSTWK